jgi:hypothetical protein
MPGDNIPMPPHLEPHALAAYLDDELAQAERAQVEAHLAECDACRAEAAAVVRVVSDLSRPGLRRPSLIVPVLVSAAAAAIFLIVRSSGDAPRTTDQALRGEGVEAGREGMPVIEIISPPDRAVTPDSILFVWRSAGPDALYHLVLGDALGDVVWQQETRDTVLRLPAGLGLDRGRDYSWHVDALLDGGRSAASRVHRFRTPP